MDKYLIPLFFAIVISYAMTPVAKKIAEKIGAIDIPKDERRVHKKPIPRLGGLAIYTASIISILVFLPIDKTTITVLIGATIIAITGIIDDMKPLKARTKLVFQILASVVLLLGDVKIDFITNPFSKGNTLFYLKAFSIPITILWVVGITNTINLIDGLDGLAAGVASIASMSLFFVAKKIGDTNIMILSIIIAGACLGFLPYNFNPAKIFMGDTGSLFLGYMLAVISIEGVMKSAATIAIVVPILILGLPIFDTTFAIFRRLLNGRPIMEADKGHLHHRLLAKGFNQKQTVLILYLISAVFGVCAVLVARSNSRQGVIIAWVVVILAIILATRLGVLDKNNNKGKS